MEFTFETHYNAKTMSVMAKALRRTVRKKHSRRSRMFGWIISAVALILMTSEGFEFHLRAVVTLGVIAAIVLALLFEDQINGYVASKRMLPGTEKAMTVFTQEEFVSTTDVGVTQWSYDKIALVAETKDFFVFIFNASYGQLYDKSELKGGTEEEFRAFIEGVTEKTVCRVK